MNLDISLQHEHRGEEGTQAFTVQIGAKQIMTISTILSGTAKKWVKDMLKSVVRKEGGVVAGVMAHRSSRATRQRDAPMELLVICMGAHCLLYHLPYPGTEQIPKEISEFLGNTHVLCVGMNMDELSTKLDADFGIPIANPVTVNTLAASKKGNPHLMDADLDCLAEAVLGQDNYVIRPQNVIPWFDPQARRSLWTDNLVCPERVKYATLDAYFLHEVGLKLLK